MSIVIDKNIVFLSFIVDKNLDYVAENGMSNKYVRRCCAYRQNGCRYFPLWLSPNVPRVFGTLGLFFFVGFFLSFSEILLAQSARIYAFIHCIVV